MKVVEGLRYSKDHEWVKTEGNKAYVGITDYAQHALGDIVFVELPKVGMVLVRGEVMGAIESVKSVSDIYSPVSGTVININEELLDTPEKINEDAYQGYIAEVELTDLEQLNELFDAVQYEAYCKEVG